MSAFGVRIARTPDEVEAFREAWQALPVENPAADLDYLVTLVRHAPTPTRPHVILVERDGRPEALAVGRAEEVRLGAKLGYKTIYRPRAHALTIAQGGFLGANGEHAEVLLGGILGALRDESLDVARLRLLRPGSALHELATTRPGVLVRGHGVAPVPHLRARIPETFADYLTARSAKTRSNINRYTRRLENRFGEGVELRVFETPAELPELIHDTRAVYVKTYQHGLGAGYSDSELAQALLELAAERGWLRAFVLYLDGVPCAFWHGTLYGRIFYTGPTGYDPQYRDLRLGTYVLAKMIEQLCGKADWMDFGLGDAEYKRHFGDESWNEEDVFVFARRLRPVALNLTRTGVLGVSRLGQAAAARSGRLEQVRRRWRDRLATAPPKEPR